MISRLVSAALLMLLLGAGPAQGALVVQDGADRAQARAETGLSSGGAAGWPLMMRARRLSLIELASLAALFVTAAALLRRFRKLRRRRIQQGAVAVEVGPVREAAVACVGLSKRFGERLAVDAVDLALRPGEVFALLGPNGAGKTTTVRMLCGLIAPTAGTVFVKGRPLLPGDESFRKAVGILTEHPGLYERLSLWLNLELFARLQGMSAALFAQRAEELLRRFALWERRDERVSGFSKGMKQKAAIVRALLHDPAVIFLDEPTSGLDPEAAREVRETIVALRQLGRTVLLTTHRLTEAEELADRVAIFQTRLLAVDTVANLRGRLYGRRMSVTLAAHHDELAQVCAALPFVKGVERQESRLLVALADPERETPELVRALVASGAAIHEVTELKQSLESVYLDLLAKAAAP